MVYFLNITVISPRDEEDDEEDDESEDEDVTGPPPAGYFFILMQHLEFSLQSLLVPFTVPTTLQSLNT